MKIFFEGNRRGMPLLQILLVTELNKSTKIKGSRGTNNRSSHSYNSSRERLLKK